MRFPCLVLDHDDTVVNSTAVIHFPSFLAYLAQVRPGLSYTLDDYFRKNFDPGIIPLFKDELGFTDEELEGEYQFWQNWVATRVPEAYPGMREILERYKARGGKIAVVSHSVSDVIRRDYREYRAVILSAFAGSPYLLTRSVLYTAITRARELLIVVGDEEVLAAMVRNDRRQKRDSGLKLRLEEGTA